MSSLNDEGRFHTRDVISLREMFRKIKTFFVRSTYLCRNDKCSFSRRTTMFVSEYNVLQVTCRFRTRPTWACALLATPSSTNALSRTQRQVLAGAGACVLTPCVWKRAGRHLQASSHSENGFTAFVPLTTKKKVDPREEIFVIGMRAVLLTQRDLHRFC